jgi:hypothetical protein
MYSSDSHVIVLPARFSLLASAATWLLLVLPILGASWWWMSSSTKSTTGEPPLVPYRIPWLGHGLAFMNDINGFTAWVRSAFLQLKSGEKDIEEEREG